MSENLVPTMSVTRYCELFGACRLIYCPLSNLQKEIVDTGSLPDLSGNNDIDYEHNAPVTHDTGGDHNKRFFVAKRIFIECKRGHGRGCIYNASEIE